MTTQRSPSQTSPPRIRWFWGIMVLAAVIQIGIVLPAATLYLLGGDPSWSPAVMVLGFLVAWSVFIGVLRVGARRAWWQ